MRHRGRCAARSQLFAPVAVARSLVAVANDVMNGEAGDAGWDATSAAPRLSQAAPDDVQRAARALVEATSPVILAGQGVLWSSATEELVELAELTGTPVATTLNGKSAFPEDHPLSLGTAARTRPSTVDRFYADADLVLGIGTSLTRSLYITPLPPAARIGQIVNDPADLGEGYDIEFGCLGDARLVLRQLIDAVGALGGRARATAAGVAEERARFQERWAPHLASESAPLSPYRVVADLMAVVDRTRTVVTHDAGHPRDEIVPFYETVVPRGYLGWGKSTQLGTGFGLALGARAAAARLAGRQHRRDMAFSMIGMDVERGRPLPHPDRHDRAQQWATDGAAMASGCRTRSTRTARTGGGGEYAVLARTRRPHRAGASAGGAAAGA